VVPWTGTNNGNGFPGTLLDTARWVSRLGCDSHVQSTFNDGTFTNLVWPNCRGNSTVELMSVRNSGHLWWTKNNGNFDTAAYAMAFFTRTYQMQEQIRREKIASRS